MFAILKKLGWFFKYRWKTYSLAVGGLVACAILNTFVPLIVGNFVDQVATGQLNSANLAQTVMTLLIFGLVMYGLRYMWRSHLFTNSTLLEAIMRKRIYRHLMRMDAQFYDRYRTGDLMAHATNDLNSLKFVAGGGIINFTDSVSITITTLFSLFVLINWKLTIIAMIPFLVLPFLARVLGKMISQKYRQALESFSSMNDLVQESVAGIQVIKSFGEEEETYQDFVVATRDVADKNKAAYQIDAAYTPLISVVTAVAYVITIFFGTYFVQIGEMTLGKLVAFFSYLATMAYPLLSVGRLANTLEKGNVSYDRISELLAEQSAIKINENPETEILGQEIEVDIKEFTYPEQEEPALKDIHFQLKEGETLGMVGPTGSGKSTIFDLLVRFYDVSQGAIYLDHINIKDYDLNILNSQLGYVTQDNLLFSMSIRDNIRFGRPDMSQDEVEYYAKIAHVHDDIVEFSEGYDTQVGERGISLSGGQKQRISIARTLAMDPKILILDDALSAVDAQTERQIINNLREHRQTGMTIVAAHRISTVMNAQEILVLSEGKISQRGNHQELMNQTGWYERMYTEQQLELKISEGRAEVDYER